MVDACCGRGRDLRLCMKRDAQSRRLDHCEVIGSVSGGQGVASATSPAVRSIATKVANLPSRPKIGSTTLPVRRPPASISSAIGAVLVEADHGGDPLGEQREAAGHQTGIGAILSHRCDQDARARREGDPPLMTSSTAAAGRPRSSATRSRSAEANSISPRMARSVMAATCALRPTWSASSSMHSCAIMVESMSARKSLLRRAAAGCTTTSTCCGCTAARKRSR